MECEIVKAMPDGSIIIPKSISAGIGIHEGEPLMVCATGDEITLKLIEAEDKGLLERDFSPLWNKAKKKGITKKDVETEIEAYRKEKRK